MTKARDLANASTALSAVSATELGYLDGVTSAVQTQLNAKQPTVANVSNTEIGYLDGVTSAIQTQLDAKQAVVSGVDNTEIGYLNGVTSAIQTQLNAKAPLASPSFTGNVGVGVVSPSSSLDVRIGTSGNTGPTSGTWTARVVNKVDNSGQNGLSVQNRWAASTSTIFEAAQGYQGTEGYFPVFTVRGDGATIVTHTNTADKAVRNTYMSTSAPSGGADGDIWIQYT